MTDADQRDLNLSTWLPLDGHPYVLNGVLLVAATSLALALSSGLWRTKHHAQHSAVERHMQEHPSSILTAALSSFHLLQPQPAECNFPSTSQNLALSDTLAPSNGEQKDRKSTRSKERRRRGKDPLKDLFKGGKKSRALLNSIQTNENEYDEAYSTPPPSSEVDQKSSTLGIDYSSSTSRSVSPDASRIPSDHHPTRLLNPSSDDGSVRNTASSGLTPIPSSVEASDHNSSSHSSHTDDVLHSAPPEAEVNVSSSSTIAIPVSETSLSSPATPAEPAESRTPCNCQAESTSGISSSKPIRIRAKLRTTRTDSSVHLPASISSPDKVPSQVSAPSPFPSTVSCPAISTPSSTCVTSVSFLDSRNDVMMDDSNYPADGVGPSTPTNSRGLTPSPYRSPQRSPPPSQVPGQVQLGSPGTTQNNTPVSAQTQLASLRGALEAARLREEKLRAEAEQAHKGRDELCWRWNEDAVAWRRREAELQAHIHHLMQQLQAYAAVASFQAQQAQNRPSSGFSSPTSPHPHPSPRLQHHTLLPFQLPPAPVIQAQNSATAPAHVQALLASAPMLTSHHLGFGFGAGVGGVGSVNGNANGGVYAASTPGAVGMSPLLWSGLGMGGLTRDPRNGGHRTPDSSASGSSSRGRRRRRAEDVKSASDDSSLGDWDGLSMEDGSAGPGLDPDGGWYVHGDAHGNGGDAEGYGEVEGEEEEAEEEEEEDMLRKNMLADAILKRPESIRGLSRVGKRRSMNGIGIGPGVGRVSSRTSVRSEGATPVNGFGMPMPLTNGTGGGAVDSLAQEVGRESESGGGFGTLMPFVDNVTVKAIDVHDRR